MTATNQAFIKAYRQDAPGASATAERAALRAAGAAAPVEQVRERGPSAVPIDAYPSLRIDEPAVGKRPLSSFTAAGPRVAVHDSPQATVFRPGTTIASFRWPSVCRRLWQQSGTDFDQLANRLLAQAADGRTLVGFLGMFPARGCTTMLLTLSARLAARGGRILVADANFAAPQLAVRLGIEPDATWHDVLSHGTPVADAIVRAIDDNLDLLPLDCHSHDSATENVLALAGGLHASISAGALRHEYDLVLMDLGAFFQPSSQTVALELVRNLRIDAAIAVAGPQPADPRDVVTIAEHLSQRGCELLGTIENQVTSDQ